MDYITAFRIRYEMANEEADYEINSVKSTVLNSVDIIANI